MRVLLLVVLVLLVTDSKQSQLLALGLRLEFHNIKGSLTHFPHTYGEYKSPLTPPLLSKYLIESPGIYFISIFK